MKGFRIRRYKNSDKKAVFRLHTLALKHTEAFCRHGVWDNDLKNIEKVYLKNNGEFLVGIANGKSIAMGALKKMSAKTAEIKRMRVHPRFQRKGYGQIIYNKLEEKAKMSGYKILNLDTTLNQKAAQNFYRKNGFKEMKRGMLGGFKTIYYEKRLK